MTSKAVVEEFLAQKTIAIVGASRDPRKFGSGVYRDLKSKGYHVIPVNPNADSIEGDRCYPSLAAIPEPVDGAFLVVPPEQAEGIVREADRAGIRRIWMQQQADSEEAVRYCQEHGMKEVHGECILMFAQPQAFFHKPHRWFNGLTGKLPK